MKIGSRPVWTEEMEEALIRLGERAEELGFPSKKYWGKALEEMEEEAEIFKDMKVDNLRKTYSRIIRSRGGICYSSKCKNKTDGANRYCDACRKIQAARALERYRRVGR